MAKVSTALSNDYCPQTLFLYGTYGADEKPDFGLFCWFSYTWDEDLGVMACIGGEKLTKDRIHENKIFSACLVTEKNLALADYFGSTDGRTADKMNIDVGIEKGQVLNVPVLTDSPLAFELEVKSFVVLNGSEVMLCKVRNVLIDEEFADQSVSVEDRLRAIAPARTTCKTYFGWDGHKIGGWGELKNTVKA